MGKGKLNKEQREILRERECVFICGNKLLPLCLRDWTLIELFYLISGDYLAEPRMCTKPYPSQTGETLFFSYERKLEIGLN